MALITDYRPSTFEEVVGHKATVKALKAAIEKQTAQTFLFTGPSGTGKTTLARITASELGCAPSDLLEIDAATYTGIDDMRAVTAQLNYRPVGGGKKAILIDECHALSKAAIQSLLKVLEEPPEWVVWLLCTTEGVRLPEAIRTRCSCFDLKPVAADVLFELLAGVAEAEKLPKTVNDDVLDLCVKEANGSPRQALANLSVCAAVKTLDEASELLRSAADSPEAVALARALVNGASWADVQKVLTGLQQTNPESVRHVVRAYVTKVVLGVKGEQAAGRGIEILDAFSEPFHSSDGISPVVLACGRLVL